MYMDLRSKLALIREKSPEAESPKKILGPDIHKIMDGSVCQLPAGAFFLVEKKYPLSHLHGGIQLGSALAADYSPLSRVYGDTLQWIRPENMCFLDTETTGLSGGTGTVAFLIGTGFFEGESFTLRQYFMRDYDEELALLQELNTMLPEKKCIVTFNGKSFDWNLLQTRFTANRLRMGLKNPLHLDLLYPSRLLWKLKLESCRLSSLEENILKINRVDDLPGALIPGVYFKYLEDRNAGDIKKVLEHNEKDILSMVSLLLRINELLSAPLSQARDAWELFGAGRLLEKQDATDSALACYEKCTTSVNPSVRSLALKKLAYLYKKNKNFEKAVSSLETLLTTSTPGIPIMIELAKHFEHRLKAPERALQLTQEALKLCTQSVFLRNMYYKDLMCRLARLQRKNFKKEDVPKYEGSVNSCAN